MVSVFGHGGKRDALLYSDFHFKNSKASLAARRTLLKATIVCAWKLATF